MTDRQQHQQQREQAYRDGIAAVAQRQWAAMAAETWEECERCRGNMRHVRGVCVECGDPDYRRLPY